MKRYSRTANLFDKDNFVFGTDTTIVYTPIAVENGTYTLSTTFPDNETKDVFFLGGNVSSGASSATNGVDINRARTVTTNDGYVTIATRYNPIRQNPANYTYMLNSGSIALPYEPYGNTWQTKSPPRYGTATDTLTTLPADLYADGNNATVGLVGNMQQTGTPTPTAPILPQETGDRTGNLSPVGSFTITAHDASQRVDIFSGILEAGNYVVALNQDNAISGSTRNTLQVTVGGTTYYNSSSANYHNQSGQQKMTFTVAETGNVDVKYWANDLNENCSYSNITFNAGSEVINEPYGYKIPISSANTTTPVYLGEVETTRKIKRLVLTGEEGWVRTVNGKCYYINSSKGCPADYLKSNIVTIICSHYEEQRNTSSGSNEVNEGCICFFTGGGFELYIGERTITSADDFKSYLAQQYAAGTPVTVWYVLATETTGIVNEPIRKIGDYADTVSGISIPTITGADSFDVLTTLKPSEIDLTYTGWHDATVEEWDGSDWQ